MSVSAILLGNRCRLCKGLVVFAWLYSVSLPVFSALPLGVFWGESYSNHLNSNDLNSNYLNLNYLNLNYLDLKRNVRDQIIVKGQYDHILESDTTLISSKKSSLSLYKTLSFLSSNVEALLALSQRQENTRLGFQSTKWDALSKQVENKLYWAFSANIYQLKLHYFNTKYSRGLSIGTGFFSRYSFYYKQQVRMINWDNEINLLTNDNNYLIDNSINYFSRELVGGGVKYNSGKFSLISEILRSRATASYAGFLKGHWLVNDNYTLMTDAYFESVDDMRDVVYVDKSTSGIWLQKFSSKNFMLGLRKKINNIDAQINISRNEMRYSTIGVYDASEIASYWSGFFVGNGSLKYNIKVTSTIIHAKYGNKITPIFKSLKHGYLWEVNAGFGRLSLVDGGQHRVAKIPFGLLINDALNNKVEGVDFLLLAFGVGYKGEMWEVFYKMKQLIPLVIKNSSSGNIVNPDEDTINDSDGNTSSNLSIKKLPNGNRQSLYVKYYF